MDFFQGSDLNLLNTTTTTIRTSTTNVDFWPTFDLRPMIIESGPCFPIKYTRIPRAVVVLFRKINRFLLLSHCRFFDFVLLFYLSVCFTNKEATLPGSLLRHLSPPFASNFFTISFISIASISLWFVLSIFFS